MNKTLKKHAIIQQLFEEYYARGREQELLKTPNNIHRFLPDQVNVIMENKRYCEHLMRAKFEQQEVVDLLKNNPQEFFRRGWLFYDKNYNQDLAATNPSLRGINMGEWRSMLPANFLENPQNFALLLQAGKQYFNKIAQQCMEFDNVDDRIWFDYYARTNKFFSNLQLTNYVQIYKRKDALQQAKDWCAEKNLSPNFVPTQKEIAQQKQQILALENALSQTTQFTDFSCMGLEVAKRKVAQLLRKSKTSPLYISDEDVVIYSTGEKNV